MASCTDLSQNENLLQEKDQNELAKPELEIDFSNLEKKMKFYEQKNQERLVNASHLKKGCDSNVRVPLDFSTIQEAVDNVCEGGNVMVSTGDYYEEVYINKPGVKIKAVGDVELIGGFILNEYADETTIQNFKINLHGAINGIFSYKADKLRISQNEIEDFPFYGNYGILLGNTNESIIHKNKIIRTGNGITLMTDDNYEGISQKNDISFNYVNSYFVSGISLIGNLDENSIKNNTVSLHAFYRVRFFGGGIALISRVNSNHFISSDNNQIKNNNLSDGTIGLLITDFNSGNEITGNEFSNNFMYGIYSLALEEGSNPNIFKNNTVRGNYSCDIVDVSGINIYLKNTADCTSGI